jgi:hypothetical protein
MADTVTYANADLTETFKVFERYGAVKLSCSYELLANQKRSVIPPLRSNSCR